MSRDGDNISMAEPQLASKIAGREEIRSEGQVESIVGTSEKVSIVIHDTKHSELNTDTQEKLKSMKAAVAEREQATKETTPSRIQTVPFTMRDNKKFKKYYDPTVVAIGPIHHHCLKLQWAEKLKLSLAGYFIKKNSLRDEDLWIKIKNELGNLKNCYEEEVVKSWNDDDLTWMFLVDGCAMLHFIHCKEDPEGDELKRLKVKSDLVAFALRDMLLLENQLPYSLLTLLISSIGDKEKRNGLNKSIKDFIEGWLTPAVSNLKRPTEDQENGEHLHLLALLWKKVAFRSDQSDSRITKVVRRCIKKCCRLGPKYPPSFRSVIELKSAGIRLKPSKTSSFNDISFEGYCIGTLRLPPIKVDDSTPTMLLNLIAFEMCPDFMNDFAVTSYVCFMDSLIDNPEDVKELRKARILNNNLGSDAEVAKLFNRIGSNLVPDPDKYQNVKEGIQKHYDSKVTTWVAQALHDHFASPWTFLAFLAATLALALTFIQTWYAAKDDKPKHRTHL